jgi:molybdopterin molybdotransferase
MRSFELISPSQALAKLYAAMSEHGSDLPIENIHALTARDRVIAENIISNYYLPEFKRSSVDGYAIKKADVDKALQNNDTLRVTSEIRMGEAATMALNHGEAIKIHTGGHVPEGADAVIMIENVEHITGNYENAHSNTSSELSNIYAIRPMFASTIGDNIIERGEDVNRGDLVIKKGTRLREQELGGLASLGVVNIKAYRQPRVAIIASGDEVVPADAPTIKMGQVRSVNTHSIAALVSKNGGIPLDYGILPDKQSAFVEAFAHALKSADVIVFMAGTSMSERDYVPDVVRSMGKPGILQHGIAFRPGKPTLFALCEGKPVLGLPGNPVSALVTGMMFLTPLIWKIQNTLNPPTPSFTRAKLAQSIDSPKSLEHWLPVKLTPISPLFQEYESEKEPIFNIESKERFIAEPVKTKSNLIFSLTRADGLVCSPIGSSQLKQDSVVNVMLLN